MTDREPYAPGPAAGCRSERTQRSRTFGDAEPVESRSQRGDVVHQGHPQREVT
jgi:hypothetical protein